MEAEKESVVAQAKRRQSSAVAFRCAWIFGAANAVVLALVLASALTGGAPSTFMWLRAAILVAIGPFLLWLAKRAGRGSIPALGRLRTLSTILPVAVIVVDFIPGVAPVWYGVVQGIAALALVPIAVVMRGESRHSVPAPLRDNGGENIGTTVTGNRE